MPRSGREARARLEQAALELYLERGFEAVTTAEIAARAGVTERTYFRHFPDKREVLFEGERRLTGWVTAALATVPDDVPPWPAMRRAIDLIVPSLEESGSAGNRLAAIVATTPALRERAAAKEANLVSLVAGLLVERGADADEADLVALTEWGLLAHAIRTWRASPGTALKRHVDRGFALLVVLVGG